MFAFRDERLSRALISLVGLSIVRGKWEAYCISELVCFTLIRGSDVPARKIALLHREVLPLPVQAKTSRLR